MIASLLIMAILIWTIGIASSAWIIIVCLSLFIVFFGISWGPVLWVMLPELFLMRARASYRAFQRQISERLSCHCSSQY